VFDIDGDNHVVSEEAGPPIHPHGPVTGNKRIRAQFAQKRTHNEQLIVAPCGVIIALGGAGPASGKIQFLRLLPY
jgi:hypothetical protein